MQSHHFAIIKVSSPTIFAIDAFDKAHRYVLRPNFDSVAS